MVQVEAMLCGVPVVASNLPGVRVPIQRTGMGKIVPPKDSEKLADAIVEVLTHRNSYRKPKVSIEKEFSFNETIGRYEETFADARLYS